MDTDPEAMQVDRDNNSSHASFGKSHPVEEHTIESQSEKEILELRLADETRLRQFTEQVLDSRHQELEKQEAQTKQFAEKVEVLKKELADAESQLAEARNQTKTKIRQLSDAKDQIFRLQPMQKDITEAEAQEKYKILCGNVQRWVENRLKGILDDLEGGRITAKAPPAQAGRLVSLMRESSKRCIRLDQSDEYHIISMIMNYLWLVFFSKSFYSPLDDYEGDATLSWIDELEASMARLPRDVAHCREWRSETLLAVSSQSAFKNRRTRYITLVSEDIASLLSIIVPRSLATELQNSLRRTIIEPAADLAHELHLATSIFSLKWPARGAWSRLEVYECLNLANAGLLLDLSGTNTSSPARRKVSYLFDMAPGLFVERFEGGKKLSMKAICRPTVVVYGADSEPNQKATIMKWLWDSAGGAQGPPVPRATAAKRSTAGVPPGSKKK